MDCVHLILSACLPLATKIRALHTELCCVLLSNEVSNKVREVGGGEGEWGKDKEIQEDKSNKDKEET